MKTRTFILALMASAMPLVATAEGVLKFPEGSVQGYETLSPAASLQLPIGPFIAGDIKTTAANGDILRQVWKTPNTQTETLVLITPLRSQLEDDGYTVLFECETRDCGGFDFRFKADVVDEPEMHVDLGDYRYLSASKLVDGREEFIGLLVSRSPAQGYIQVTKIGTESFSAAPATASTKQSAPVAALLQEEPLGVRLSTKGMVVLEGLEFGMGSSDLDGDSISALQDLASLLAADPSKIVVLVGHTDASGSLEGNVALSRKRADSVMQRLVDTYGVNPAQISAEGVGYLSPRASNATDEGRDQNRRVEVVLTTVE